VTEERQRKVNVEHAKKIQAGKPGQQPAKRQPQAQRKGDQERANRMQTGKPDRSKGK
jgi:hypothetical protein